MERNEQIRTISAVFAEPEAANEAVEGLLEAGFEDEVVSLLMSRRTRLLHHLV